MHYDTTIFNFDDKFCPIYFSLLPIFGIFKTDVSLDR